MAYRTLAAGARAKRICYRGGPPLSAPRNRHVVGRGRVAATRVDRAPSALQRVLAPLTPLRAGAPRARRVAPRPLRPGAGRRPARGRGSALTPNARVIAMSAGDAAARTAMRSLRVALARKVVGIADQAVALKESGSAASLLLRARSMLQ